MTTANVLKSKDQCGDQESLVITSKMKQLRDTKVWNESIVVQNKEPSTQQATSDTRQPKDSYLVFTGARNGSTWDGNVNVISLNSNMEVTSLGTLAAIYMYKGQTSSYLFGDVLFVTGL